MNVLLFGGGLDSAALFIHLVRNKIPFVSLFVDYGQEAELAEYDAVYEICNKHKIQCCDVVDKTIKNLSSEDALLFGRGTNPYVNGRNLGLLYKAAEFIMTHKDNSTKEHTIYIGFYDVNDPVPDAGEEFLDTINKIFALSFFNDHKIKVEAPLIGLPKVEAIRQALEYDKDILNMTMTCWTPNYDLLTQSGSECGECKHCLKKKQIARELGYE